MGKKTKREKTGDQHLRRNMVDALSDLHKPWVVKFDGGCENNGSPDAIGDWGCIVIDANENPHDEGSGPATGNPVTNNTAEFEALYEGVCRVPDGTPELIVRGDSQLVIFLVSGKWGAKKPEMAMWRNRVLERLCDIGCRWYALWVEREQNTEADALTRRREQSHHDIRVAKRKAEAKKRKRARTDCPKLSEAEVHHMTILRAQAAKAALDLAKYRHEMAEFKKRVSMKTAPTPSVK